MFALSWIIFAALVVIPLLVLIGFLAKRMERGRKNVSPDTFAVEAEPLHEEMTVVAGKFAGQRRAGWRDPANRTGFLITFRLEDGDEVVFSVSSELFESIREGERGMLVTHCGNFIDFGDRAVAGWLPGDEG